MSAAEPFEYAVVRAVPRVDRGEFVNVGVVVYSQAREFLAAGVRLDADRVRALDAGVDLEVVAAGLDAIRRVCAGDPSAGRAAEGPPRARFGWLTAPRSTVVQCGPVHCGLTLDPAEELERLLDRLVAPPVGAGSGAGEQPQEPAEPRQLPPVGGPVDR